MDKYEKHLIEKTKKIILDKKNPNRLVEIEESMNEVYKYFKDTIKTCSFTDERLIEIFKLESLLNNEFLPLENEPIFNKFNNPILPSSINNEQDCIKVLEYIVHKTREKLNETDDIKNSTLKAKCITGTYITEDICKSINITQKRYSCSEDLSPGVFHCFNVITFNLPNNKTIDYIVDCTYRQFFTYSDSFLERIGIMYNCGASIGKYMIMDNDRKETAEHILKHGYIKAEEKTIKQYLDGFIFTGRNGHFYEELNKDTITSSDYEPKYSCSDYIYALNNGGIKEKHIGRMTTPLRKNIDFNLRDNKFV